MLFCIYRSQRLQAWRSNVKDETNFPSSSPSFGMKVHFSLLRISVTAANRLGTMFHMLGAQGLGWEVLGNERGAMDHADIWTSASAKEGAGLGQGAGCRLPAAFCGLRHVLFQRTGKVTEGTGGSRRNPQLGLELAFWYVGTDSSVSLASPLCQDLDVDGLSLQEFKLEGSKRKTGLWSCVWKHPLAVLLWGSAPRRFTCHVEGPKEWTVKAHVGQCLFLLGFKFPDQFFNKIKTTMRNYFSLCKFHLNFFLIAVNAKMGKGCVMISNTRQVEMKTGKQLGNSLAKVPILRSTNFTQDFNLRKYLEKQTIIGIEGYCYKHLSYCYY